MMIFALPSDPEIQENIGPVETGPETAVNRKDNEMSIVTKMTTAELLAYYNANSGKPPVKRFADRKTAEKRVSDLITSKSKEMEEVSKPKKTAAKKAKKTEDAKKTGGGAKRTAVVYGKDTYQSLVVAFQQLKLPLGRLIPARKKLKAEGSLDFVYNDKTFSFKVA